MDIKLKSKLSKISTFIFDVDGVFTDATLTVGDTDVTRTFNVRDGYAVQMAVKSGYNIAIISGGKQESIAKRMRALGVQDVFLSVPTDKKLQYFDEYIQSKNIKENEVLFVGDDIPDYLVMTERDILSCCPSDAVSEVIGIADYISNIAGGKGVVRDVIEMVMKSQDKWMKVL
jgi:3-deoxy-D-manno-octulosonate 8-phosphate phosphatase (KDO 8-P phosphatase)